MRKTQVKCKCPSCGLVDYFDEDEVNSEQPPVCSECHGAMVLVVTRGRPPR